MAVERKTQRVLEMTAAPLRSSGRESRIYRLIVHEIEGELQVKESGDSRLLPEYCPQRHMNDNGSFCLGLVAGSGICDATTANRWWQRLQVFLTCQETAHETGVWPEYAQLSHGVAGEYEYQAEELARTLGVLGEYRDSVRYDTGQIACFAGRVDRSSLRLRNGRARCPCGRTDRAGRPILRRQCWKAQHRCLAVLEFKRRQALERFWASIKDKHQCCGTMTDCPLQSTSASSS